MYQEPPATPSSPRPFSELPGLWTKVLQMTEEFFAQEAPRASGSNTLISVLILAAIATVLAVISSAIMGGVQMAFLPREYREAAAAGIGGNTLCSLCSGLVGTLLGFYLGNGLVYLGARVLGGSGEFGTQTYLASLFAVPLGAVSGVLGLIPIVGALAALAVSAYALVLNVRTVKVVHGLTTGKAVVAVLWPVLLIFVLSCLIIVVLALLGPAIGNVFSDIVTNI